MILFGLSPSLFVEARSRSDYFHAFTSRVVRFFGHLSSSQRQKSVPPRTFHEAKSRGRASAKRARRVNNREYSKMLDVAMSHTKQSTLSAHFFALNRLLSY